MLAWPFSIGGDLMEVVDIVALFVQIVEWSVPFAIVFGLGEYIVTVALRAAFGGRLSFRV